MKNKNLILILTILLIVPFNSFAMTYYGDDDDDVCVKNEDGVYTHYNIINKGSSVNEISHITTENIFGTTITSSNITLKTPTNCFISSGLVEGDKENHDYEFNPNDLTYGVGKYVDIVKNEKNEYVATCKKEYSFESSVADRKCVKTDGGFYTCPDDASSLEIGNLDLGDRTYDYSSKKWKFKIKVNKDSKNVTSNYRIEVVEYKYSNNISIDGNKYSGFSELSEELDEAKKNGASNFKVYPSDGILSLDVTPGKKYKLFFVVNSGECSDTPVFPYDVHGNNDIPNKWKENDYCTSFASQIGGYDSLTSNFAKSVVSPCFKDTLSYNEYGKLSDNEIKSKIEKKIEYFDSLLNKSASTDTDTTDSSNKYSCYFENGLKNKESNTISVEGNDYHTGVSSYSETSVMKEGAYWSIICTETLSLQYDPPARANYNGGGFEYNAKITTNKTCQLAEIAYPQPKEECSYGVLCYGGYPGDYDTVTGLSKTPDSTGPNDDFDDCVSTCDGGRYTQSCINKCYNQVYVKNRTTSLTSINDKINLLPLYSSNKKITPTKIANYSSNGYTNTGEKIIQLLPSDCNGLGLTRNYRYWCKNKKTKKFAKFDSECSGDWFFYDNIVNVCTGTYKNSYIQYEQSAVCISKGAECYLVQFSSSSCVEDAEADFQAQLAYYESEYKTYIGYLSDLSNSYSNEESFKIQIDEADIDYSNNKNDITSKSTIYGSGKLDYDYEMNVSSKVTSSPLTVYDISDHGKELKSASSSKTIYLGISKNTYRNRVINKFTYLPKGETTDSFKNNNFYEDAALKNGYYLQMNSIEVNNPDTWPTTEENNKKVDTYTKNIKLNLYNLGSWQQWGKVSTINSTAAGIEVDCFYGTDSTTTPKYICKKGNDDNWYDKSGSMYNDKDVKYTSEADIKSNNLPSDKKCYCYVDNNTYYINYGVPVSEAEWLATCDSGNGGTSYSCNTGYKDGVWWIKGNTNTSNECKSSFTNSYSTYKKCCNLIDGGNDFIFRVIKLGDMFPNDRNPRFNWSDYDAASLRKGTLYKDEVVDPTALIQDIESKSENIYDSTSGEVDYEFTLTKKQIRAIKDYNKNEKKSNRVYTDYLTEKKPFECKQNGCLSTFVSDATYVTWVSGNRAAIAKCNNAKENGSKCDNIGG